MRILVINEMQCNSYCWIITQMKINWIPVTIRSMNLCIFTAPLVLLTNFLQYFEIRKSHVTLKSHNNVVMLLVYAVLETLYIKHGDLKFFRTPLAFLYNYCKICSYTLHTYIHTHIIYIYTYMQTYAWLGDTV